MDESGKTREELLGQVEELRRQLAACEQDRQIIVDGLRDEHRLAEAEWRRRLESLEAKLAGSSSEAHSPLPGLHRDILEGGDSERERLLATVQVQAEELQAVNEELTLQSEELRIQNEELVALTEILEEQKLSLQHLARELETERTLLKSVLDQMPASVVIVAAPAGPILLSNRLADQIWSESLQSRADLDAYWRIPREYPDGRLYRKEETPLWRSLTLGEVIMDEEMILRPQGAFPIHLSISSAPVRDDQGAIVAGVVTHSDITARKQAEEALRESQRQKAFFADLLENSSQPFGVGFPDGHMGLSNAAFPQLLGYTKEEFLTLDWVKDLTPPEWEEKEAAALEELHRTGQPVRYEKEYFRKDGTRVPVELLVHLRRDEHGQALHYYAFITDITARQAAEAEIRRMASFPLLNPNPVLELDSAGAITYCNQAALAALASLGEAARPEAFFPEDLPDILITGRDQGEGRFYREVRIKDKVFAEDISYAAPFEVFRIYARDITERQAAEEALLQREAQLRTILENVTEGVVVADLDGRLSHWNPAAVAMHGFANMEEGQRRLPEFTDLFELSTTADGILPVEQWPLARILRGETLRDWEVDVRRKDNGWQRVFNYGGTLARDREGRPVLAVVSVSDITERKTSEVALRESREDLNRAQAVALVGSWRLDVGRNELLWSDETYRMFGIPQGTPLTYEAFLALLHPEDRKHVDQKWTEALQGEPYDIEHRIVVGDTVKWVREKAELEFDPQGRLLGGFGTVQDITERKTAELERLKLLERLQESQEELQVINEELQAQTEELQEANQDLLTAQSALRESEARFRGLFEHMTEGVALHEVIYDSEDKAVDYRILATNPAFSVHTGLQPEEVQGQLASTAFGVGEAPFLETYAQVAQTGQPVSFETFFPPLQRHFAISATSPHPGQFVTVFEDITTRKRMQETLRESREDLNRAQAVAQTGSWRLDVQRNELTWSEENYRIFGVPQGTPMTYEGFLAIVHPEDQEYVDQRWMAALRGEPYDIEHRLIVGDTVKWVRERAELEFDSQGRLLGGFGTTQDITVHKQAEEALRLSNQRLDLLAETAGLLLASASPQEVAEAICQKVMAFLDCDACFNFLVDENEGRLRLNTFAGIPPEEAKKIEWLDYGTAVCGCAAQEGSRIVTEQIQTTPDPRTELVRSYGIQAYACHPLLMQGRVLGTLSFGTRSRPRFTPDELALMKAVADQVAVAMDRKRAEDAIIRAKEEWERTFDSVPDFIALLDTEHRITRMNRAMSELLGKTQEEVIGKPCYNVVHGLDEAPDFCPHSKVVATGREHSAEVTEFGRIFAVSDSPIFGPNGQLLGGVHVARDITARKEAEEALKRAHDELEQRVKERTAELRKQADLLELAQEAIIVKDLDSRVTFWNRGAEEIYGWTREQATGRVITTLLKTRFPLAWEEIEQNLLQRGQWQGELAHTRADGEEIVVASRMAVQRNDAGEPIAILEINRDVTARRRAEEALETERQRLLEVLERIPAHVTLLRPDYTIAYVNGEFIRQFGEPGSKRCHELVGLQNPCAECQAKAVFQNGAPVSREWTGPNGHTYQMYDYPFIDTDGSPLVLEMGVDITARKRAEEALRESEERLRYLASQLLHAQESERRRLALELHDDLGQSLMVLKLQLRSIEKAVPSDQWQIREECTHSLEYLNGVVENVRRLARNLRPAVLEDLGLAAGLRVLSGEFRKYHEAELSLEMDDIEGLFSRDDEINIYRIFQETLTNIGKHAQARRVNIVIKHQDGGVSFQVMDDGLGFDLERVLTRDAAKQGLGLAALEERVHMLGGTLEIRSQEDLGTEISFTVPAEDRIEG
jgi:PAS domain S-box-containing protein